MLKDIHTHHLSAPADACIYSVCRKDAETDAFRRAEKLSVGIHPWYLQEEDFPLQMTWMKEMLHDPRVLAIGEGGLDKRCETPFPLQERAFKFLIELSEAHHLPLVIHCVKCVAELIRYRKEFRPRSPWIMHGFRGKPQQAAELIRHGFYLSFGEHYSEEALQLVPSDRFFLETDESSLSIDLLYERAARVRNQSVEKIEESVFDNINNVFY